MTLKSYQVNNKKPLRSYGEPLTRIDNRINDRQILSSQGEKLIGELQRATDSYELRICTDNKINDSPMLSSQGEQ